MHRLAPLLLVASCAAGAPVRPPTTATRATPGGATTITTRTHFRYAGRLWNAAIAALPAGARRATFGQPGPGYRLGVVRDPAAWRAFAAASEIRDLPAVMFPDQMVVFAVRHSNTNQLSPATWKVDQAGRAVFSFGVAGAEPSDPDAAAGTLAVVDRARVRSITFRTLGGRDLGTVAL